MICPECKSKLKKVLVSVEDAKSKVISYQCSKCDYFKFDRKTGMEVLKELRRCKNEE